MTYDMREMVRWNLANTAARLAYVEDPFALSRRVAHHYVGVLVRNYGLEPHQALAMHTEVDRW